MTEVTSLIRQFLDPKKVVELEKAVEAIFTSKNVIPSPEKNKRIITMEEVSQHDEPNDCWLIIFDRVYDVTTFIDEVGIAFPMNIFRYLFYLQVIYIVERIFFKIFRLVEFFFRIFQILIFKFGTFLIPFFSIPNSFNV